MPLSQLGGGKLHLDWRLRGDCTRGGRTTKDIDLLVDDSSANIARIKTALSVLEDNAAADVNDSDVRDYTVVRIADEVVIDLLGKACGVTYEDAARDMEWIEHEGVRIPVASKRTLIKTKNTIRPSDKADCQFLISAIEAENDK